MDEHETPMLFRIKRGKQFGGKWREVRIKPVFCNWYYTGREYDSRQIVNFKRMKAAF